MLVDGGVGAYFGDRRGQVELADGAAERGTEALLTLLFYLLPFFRLFGLRLAAEVLLTHA